MTCGYEFKQNYNVENVEIMKNIIESILPAKDIRDYYLSILATGLCGIQIENFIIATGGGGNGKSLLNLYAIECIGNYSYILPNDFLTSPLKSGCDPQTANIAKKRLVLSQEPQGNQKIKASTMKEITGNQKINARSLYSDKCDDKFLTLTLIMECNKCPLIDEVNDAINRRIRLVPFNEVFKCENEFNILTEEKKIGVSIANPKYKEPRFYKEMRQALFIILIDSFKTIYQNEIKLPEVPTECRKQQSEYLASSDNIYEWFKLHFERVETKEKLYFKDVYEVFIGTDAYKEMTKASKREFSISKFSKMLEENFFIKKFIKARNSHFNGERLNKDVITGWTLKPEEKEEVKI